MDFLLALILVFAIFMGVYFAYKHGRPPGPLQETANIERKMLKQLNDLLEKADGYQKSNNFAEAETAYKEALKLRRQQAMGNAAHQIDVAITLNSMGNLYSDMREYDLSRQSYAEALDIYRQHARENPAWLPYVGRTLNNFATLYLLTRKTDLAEELSREGVDILRACWKENPDRYGNDLAKTILVLAHVTSTQKGKDESVIDLAREAERVATAKDIQLKSRKMIEKVSR